MKKPYFDIVKEEKSKIENSGSSKRLNDKLFRERKTAVPSAFVLK